jgi:hypothetical protein
MGGQLRNAALAAEARASAPQTGGAGVLRIADMRITSIVPMLMALRSFDAEFSLR